MFFWQYIVSLTNSEFRYALQLKPQSRRQNLGVQFSGGNHREKKKISRRENKKDQEAMQSSGGKHVLILSRRQAYLVRGPKSCAEEAKRG